MKFKNKLEELIAELPDECFETLTFKDLEVGNKYIALPLPGDNEGHYGYKVTHFIFEKITPMPYQDHIINSKRCKDGYFDDAPDNLQIIKIK